MKLQSIDQMFISWEKDKKLYPLETQQWFMDYLFDNEDELDHKAILLLDCVSDLINDEWADKDTEQKIQNKFDELLKLEIIIKPEVLKYIEYQKEVLKEENKNIDFGMD